MQWKITVIYMLVLGLLSVILTLYDKVAAIKHKTRIPERSLLIIGLMGGAIPMFAAMQIIRHKTKKPKFMICLPLFGVLHLAAAILLFPLIIS